MPEKIALMLSKMKDLLDTMSNKAPRGKLFPECSMNRIQYVWALIRKVLKNEDPGFMIHSIRHTVASRLVSAGVPIYTISKVLGHRSVKTTERYAQLNTDDLAKAMKLLEDADRAIQEAETAVEATIAQVVEDSTVQSQEDVAALFKGTGISPRVFGLNSTD
jgi:hypothetical protein